MRARNRLIVTAALFLSACGGNQGIPEFQHYRDAFRAQRQAGVQVFDRLAAGERRLSADQTARDEVEGTFDPDRATLYLGVGDPPMTAALRAGLDTVVGYNEALADLASGAAAERLSSGLGAIADNTVATGLLLAGGSPTAADVGRTLTGAVRRALPVLQRIRAARDRETFRERLVEAHSEMRAVLERMRAETPEIFRILHLARVEAARTEGTDLSRLTEDRRLLAGWVLLIDQAIIAMDQAVAAARTGGKVDVPALVDASIRLRVLAETVTRAQ